MALCLSENADRSVQCLNDAINAAAKIIITLDALDTKELMHSTLYYVAHTAISDGNMDSYQ